MKITEKLITIAENQEKVYDAGKQSMIDESKIIEKTVTRHGCVCLKDVSEIPHDIRVKLTSDTIEDLSAVKLYTQGKNLISPDIYDLSKWSKIGTTTRYLYYLNLPVGIYTISAEKSIEDTYFHLAISTDNWTTCEYVYVLTPNTNSRRTFTVEEGKQYALWVAENYLPNVYNVQIEIGSDYTGYEEPIGPIVYDVKTEGFTEGVKSISPIMTLYASSDTQIQMTYHKSFGMQTEYDRFWDTYQDYGNRSNYRGAFCSGMTPSNFYPKYDIKPNNAYHCFCMFGLNDGENPIDFVERLEECGVVLDMSGIGSMGYTFCWTSAVKRLGVLDLQTPTNLNNGFFSMSSCVSIDKVILKDDGSQTIGNAFSENTNLKNIAFEGMIGTSLQLQSSPLTVDSMKNIISHLKNYVGTDKESTQTIKFSGACWTALEDSGTAPNGETWKSYVQSDLGWLV